VFDPDVLDSQGHLGLRGERAGCAAAWAQRRSRTATAAQALGFGGHRQRRSGDCRCGGVTEALAKARGDEEEAEAPARTLSHPKIFNFRM
jgi:hypothetical protein